MRILCAGCDIKKAVCRSRHGNRETTPQPAGKASESALRTGELTEESDWITAGGRWGGGGQDGRKLLGNFGKLAIGRDLCINRLKQ